MSEKSMNDLPNELVIAILRQLDRNSLNAAVLTCKLWMQLIESTINWTLVLNDKKKSQQWIDHWLKTKRKFNEIKIKDCWGLIGHNVYGGTNITKIFTRLESSVVKLVVQNSYMYSLEGFSEMLSCLPNLEHVILHSARICASTLADDPRKEKLPELIKLKTLEMVDSENSFIICFTRAQLKTFKIHRPYCFFTESSKVRDFLCSQQHLTTLALRENIYHRSKLFATGALDEGIQFQLTKLSLVDIKLKSPDDYYNALNFLKHHEKTLTDLDLENVPEFIYEFSLAKFKNLTSLQVLVCQLPTSMEFYLHLEEHRNLKNLILTQLRTLGLPSFNEFIRHVPNITNLTLLEFCDKRTAITLADNLTKLQELTVSYFSKCSLGGVQFPRLTTLKIHKLDVYKIDWNQFTKDNSQITELSIEEVDNGALTDYDIQMITKNLKLKTLKIGKGFLPNVNFFSIIRINCSALKILHLHELCDGKEDDVYGLSNIPGLRFCDSANHRTAMYCKGLQIRNNHEV